MTRNSHDQGFTLLEMLIAIAIFAMIGLASNTVLHTVMLNDESTRDFSAKLKAMQQGFGMVARDFNQMVPRTPRLFEGGRASTVFQTGSDILDSESEAIVFFRLGWLNPDGLLPRGTLQSVAYVVKDGNLERWYFPYPDPEMGAEPIKTIIMKKVISVEYSFFVEGKWERKVDATALPQAISMQIELEGMGKVVRKFLLVEAIPKTSDSSSSSGTTTSSRDSSDGSGK
ncbi:type II secretion system minor pseudopilin GspJ [Shewanella surugensis]|uniref:Type II secretion system protein J n=1 Tax=Shewanella surugensis TaxID=212020 RepID=A0ABT0L8J3_9GAMM|nr:type II secretion system minor pseudopilin GspJ [Shewanella surugensis]MCL1124012.1 type II secretion system minor pseudopilin GspJ [Shewanella surugensis]